MLVSRGFVGHIRTLIVIRSWPAQSVGFVASDLVDGFFATPLEVSMSQIGLFPQGMG